ncbi:hypothetical protein [Bacillus hominis]|uniref:hypothetical protein n=1 Tax=Bacillus hominis TaxID=2817478 RepID=UPI001BB309D3|nr:hypothetical protein [Bacillus hominis]
MPYLEQHFGHKQISNNLYPHGVGSKRGKMWDLQFIFGDFNIYDKNAQRADVNGNEIPSYLRMSAAPYVNTAVFERYDASAKLLELVIIDMKTFKKVGEITETIDIENSVPVLYGKTDFATFLNGDIVVMNYPKKRLTLYDKKGKFKKSVSGIYEDSASQMNWMMVHARKGIIACRYGNGFKFYNKNLDFLFQVVFSGVSLSFLNEDFLHNGDLLIKESNPHNVYTRVVMDYENKKVVRTYSTPLTDDNRDGISLIRITKEKIYFKRDDRSIGTSSILECDNNLNVLSDTNPPYLIPNLVLVDDRYYHTLEDNGRGGLYKTYSLATNQLVLQYDKSSTSPNTLRSLRGQAASYS